MPRPSSACCCGCCGWARKLFALIWVVCETQTFILFSSATCCCVCRKLVMFSHSTLTDLITKVCWWWFDGLINSLHKTNSWHQTTVEKKWAAQRESRRAVGSSNPAYTEGSLFLFVYSIKVFGLKILWIMFVAGRGKKGRAEQKCVFTGTIFHFATSFPVKLFPCGILFCSLCSYR